MVAFAVLGAGATAAAKLEGAWSVDLEKLRLGTQQQFVDAVVPMVSIEYSFDRVTLVTKR